MPRRAAMSLLALLLAGGSAACSRERKIEPLLPPETFSWVRQPVTFSPPPSRWERQGDNSGGMLGVRFVLPDSGGQVIRIAAYRLFAERARRATLESLIARRGSLTQREFLHELSLARAREDDPLSDREATAARRINEALSRAVSSVLANDAWAVESELQEALRAAPQLEPTLGELLPRIRMRPERMQEPERWRIGRERDTTWAGLPAYATDDTLFVEADRPFLYHEVFWVVNGCAFKATYQGLPQNLETFHRVVDSIQFPEAEHALAH